MACGVYGVGFWFQNEHPHTKHGLCSVLGFRIHVLVERFDRVWHRMGFMVSVGFSL